MFKLTVITISVSFISFIATTDSAQAVTSIRITYNEYQINYPESIDFQLGVSSDQAITEIKFLYSLSDKPVQIYGYPEFASGRDVLAKYSIRTRGANFLPAGVEIKYFYLIKVSSGTVLKTDVSTITYLDPSYNWNQSSYGDLILIWHDIPEDDVRKILLLSKTRIEAAAVIFRLPQVKPIRAVVFNDRDESQRGMPFVSYASSRHQLFRGFAFPEFNQFLLEGLNEDGIVHESIHLLLKQSTTSPFAKVPAWLNEGLATYFETRGNIFPTPSTLAIQHDHTLKLNSMAQIPGQPDEIRAFYSKSLSIVSYMISTYGSEPISDLLLDLNEGSDLNEALRSVYGFGISDLENQWLTHTSDSRDIRTSFDKVSFLFNIEIMGILALAIVITTYVRVANKFQRYPEPRHHKKSPLLLKAKQFLGISSSD